MIIEVLLRHKLMKNLLEWDILAMLSSLQSSLVKHTLVFTMPRLSQLIPITEGNRKNYLRSFLVFHLLNK